MSEKGNMFFQHLSDLQYPRVQKFSPSSFEWLFDNEESRLFLDWFCSSVSEKNILSCLDLEKFQLLQKNGIILLGGTRLYQALEFQPAGMKCEDIVSEIQQLESSKQNFSLKKQEYVTKLNVLNFKCQKISFESCKFPNQREETKEAINSTSIKHSSSLLTQDLEQLQKFSSELKDFLLNEKLLFHQSFSQYLHMEDQCTNLLIEHASRKFDQKMSQMGQNSGAEFCAYFQTENPSNGYLIGMDSNTRTVQNWELSCLQTKLPLALEDSIVNEIELSALQSALRLCKSCDARMDSKFCVVEQNLSKKCSSVLEEEICTLGKNLSQLNNHLCNSIFKATQLRCSSIIVGDCSLKLLRQEIFLVKLKEFLSLVAQQWTREQFALLALRIEWRQLETLLTMIKNVDQQSADRSREQNDRKEICKELHELVRSLFNRNTVTSFDIITCALQSTIDLVAFEESEARSYDDLTCSSTHLVIGFDSVKERFRKLRSIFVDHLKKLKHFVDSLEKLTFDSELDELAYGTCKPQVLDNNITTLNTSRADMHNHLKPLYREFKTRLLGLKNDHLSDLERRLWVLFYNDVNTMIRKTESMCTNQNIIQH